jgi:hypothetical protein
MTPQQREAYDLMLHLIKTFDQCLDQIANEVYGNPTMFRSSRQTIQKMVRMAEHYQH